MKSYAIKAKGIEELLLLDNVVKVELMENNINGFVIFYGKDGVILAALNTDILECFIINQGCDLY
ncbi:hypothetical protein [Ornithinibacillus sp. JPR2-1]|uniref:hypothetical protein n=1 Tax=Ornithinibacillus sp. JPR2-1 TaxID=2094019 RepID=UPI0031D03AA3